MRNLPRISTLNRNFIFPSSFEVSLLLFKMLLLQKVYRIEVETVQAAALFHLDSSLSESQACSPHCPDSYLCNCLPVREEYYSGAASSASCHPLQDRRHAPMETLECPRPLLRCQKRLHLLLCPAWPAFRIQLLSLRSIAGRLTWIERWRVSRVQVLSLSNKGAHFQRCKDI